MIIDTEAHSMIFARPHRTNPNWSMVKHYTWHEHSPELLVAEMDQAGVDKAFMITYDGEDMLWDGISKGLTLEDFAGGPKYCRAGMVPFPDRFWWFPTVKDPKKYDAVGLVRKDFSVGAVGIKLLPAYINSNLDDIGITEIMDVVRSHHGTVLISFQTLRPPKTPTIEQYLAQTDRLLNRYSDVNFALLQGGCIDPLGPQSNILFDLVRRHQNVFLSTAQVGEIWDDDTEYPFPNYLRRIERLVREIGADRLMWGTDWPWFEDKFKYKQSVDCIRRHGQFMSDEEKALFLGKSALKFMRA